VLGVELKQATLGSRQQPPNKGEYFVSGERLFYVKNILGTPESAGSSYLIEDCATDKTTWMPFSYLSEIEKRIIVPKACS
jgi:hypothetical protein